MARAEIDVVDAMKGATFHVRVRRGTELRWRFWLATKLFLLAALVLNCNIDVQGLED